LDEKAQAMARVHASKALLDRAWGASAIETDFALRVPETRFACH
jgi:hypothetical protein